MILVTMFSLYNAIVLAYVALNLIRIIRTIKYQKLWYKEKIMLLKCTPKPTKAELCEKYVMFCLRNDCKVDF